MGGGLLTLALAISRLHWQDQLQRSRRALALSHGHFKEKS